ncbi:uncharacterized protein [Branchiostoma lanceolatum]|uniref:uncharacterized protein n=1 Tax=Branchiostoma lanceolatum TaxID=7740 RepID=UPI0034543B7D
MTAIHPFVALLILGLHCQRALSAYPFDEFLLFSGAAIIGHDDDRITGISRAECLQACLQGTARVPTGTCRSADYDFYNNICYLALGYKVFFPADFLIGLSRLDHYQILIDECVESTHDCSHGCVDEADGFSCTCPPAAGLTLGPDTKICVDIDECSQNNGGCAVNEECVNVFGSFYCACLGGGTILVNSSTCSACQHRLTDNLEAAYIWDLPPITSPYTVKVRAIRARGVYMALSSDNGDTDSMIQIVIGDQSSIGHARGLTAAATPNILPLGEYRVFWLTWSADGTVAVRAHEESLPFIQMTAPGLELGPVRHIGYHAGAVGVADWDFCYVNGDWSEWGSWAPCDAPCGFGMRARSRTCTDPPPVHVLGGTCIGQAAASILCLVPGMCQESDTWLEGLFDPGEANISWADWQENWKTGKFLPPGYDTTEAPSEIGGMDVASNVYILNIGSLSEKHANIFIRVQYVLSWVDSRLFGIAPSWIPVPPTLLWSPPLAFGQSVRTATTEEEEDNSMWLDQRGLIVYKITRLLRVSCVAELERYPLDTQICRVALLGYNGIRLRLQPSNNVARAPIKSDATGVTSQFTFIGVEESATFQSFISNDTAETGCEFFNQVCDYLSEPCMTSLSDTCKAGMNCAICSLVLGTCQFKMSSCPTYINDTSAFTSLELRMRLRRVLWRYLLTAYLPSVVIVVASYLQIWLSPKQSAVSARVVLGTTAAERPRAIDVWMLGCLSFVTVALLETAIVNYISTYLQDQEQMKIRFEQRGKEQNPPIRIPRPGLRNTTASASGQSEAHRSSFVAGDTRLCIPRARLHAPPSVCWHQLPDKEWVIVLKKKAKNKSA